MLIHFSMRILFTSLQTKELETRNCSRMRNKDMDHIKHNIRKNSLEIKSNASEVMDLKRLQFTHKTVFAPFIWPSLVSLRHEQDSNSRITSVVLSLIFRLQVFSLKSVQKLILLLYKMQLLSRFFHYLLLKFICKSLPSSLDLLTVYLFFSTWWTFHAFNLIASLLDDSLYHEMSICLPVDQLWVEAEIQPEIYQIQQLLESDVNWRQKETICWTHALNSTQAWVAQIV